MVVVPTSRLWLAHITAQVVDARLVGDDFVAALAGPEGACDVHFGPEWPGDALGFFLHLRAAFARDEPYPHQFVVVDRGSPEAVAMVGAVAAIDADGDLEIGYGTNASWCGRGIATEAVEALTVHLLGRPRVRRVTATTWWDNVASHRVLQKAGFSHVSTRPGERGDLLTWARPAAAVSR